jgi:hypothetical protein
VKVRNMERGGSKISVKCKSLFCVGVVGHGNNLPII